MPYKIHHLEGYIQSIYLVEQDNSFFIMDGCCRPDISLIENYITKTLKRNWSDLKLVISTHAHPDHMGGLKYFKEKGVEVAGPKNLNSWYNGPSGFFTYWVDILLTYLVAMSKKKNFQNILFPRQIKLDLELSEGDTIPGFEGWKILECPGHTNVDLSIYHASTKKIYIADNFVGRSMKIFRPYPIGYPIKYKASLQRYLDFGVNDFLLAHHGEVQISSDRIKELINTTPEKARRHLNTLPAILFKLMRSSIRKLFKL